MLVDQNPDDIINICKRLGIHDEISTLPNGYDTIMDGNCTLSTSAKQILAIARILLKNSRILVFDKLLEYWIGHLKIKFWLFCKN